MSVDMSIHRAVYLPPHIPTNVSLSQFLNTYNPDLVLGEKVILEDDWTGKTVTYCGIRESAARLALGLKLKLGLAVGDAVAICGPNSV
jgi:4-coumarate--CoA ligase